MILLAQLLNEFEDDATEAFEPLTASRAPAKGGLQFEHLTLVRSAPEERAPESIAAVLPHISGPDTAPATVQPCAADHRRELEDAVAAARAAAFAEGREAMRAEIEAGFAAALDGERVKAQAEKASALQAARAEWVDGEGRRLAAHVVSAVAEIGADIRATFGGVLKPLASDARLRQTLAELADAVGTLTGDGTAFAIRASGSADLLEALRHHLGARAALISFQPDEINAELRIEADRTVIETRLAGWREALDEALA